MRWEYIWLCQGNTVPGPGTYLFDIICLCVKSTDSEQCFSVIPACWCWRSYSSPYKKTAPHVRWEYVLRIGNLFPGPGYSSTRTKEQNALICTCLLSQQIQGEMSFGFSNWMLDGHFCEGPILTVQSLKKVKTPKSFSRNSEPFKIVHNMKPHKKSNNNTLR